MSDNEDNFDDEGLDDLENAEEEGQENVEILPSGERLLMTKYEQARVLGAELACAFDFLRTPLLAAKQMVAFPSLYSSACSTPGDYPDWNKQYLRQLCSLEGYTF
uniref:Uncharacterized protein n=1 Tax=Gopherus agassizii TaxID=38772 RepID=A0A452GNH5_9SAUR